MVRSWFLLLLAVFEMNAMALNGARAATAGYDVRRLLGTKTSYAQRLLIPGAPSIYSTPDPPGYSAHAMWLLSRHGTRWPTIDRMKQINSLEPLIQSAKNTGTFPWMKNWTSPTAELQYAAGELHPIGENELWSLAMRLRTRFPTLLRSPYLPRRFPIQSTQVPRAAASASAFAAGFFPSVPALGHEDMTGMPRGWAADGGDQLRNSLLTSLHSSSRALGTGALAEGDTVPERVRHRPQPVAINMLPKRSDPLLRFYDMCPEYAQREEYLANWLGAWLADNWSELAPGVSERMGAPQLLAPCDVQALWTLCQVEGGLQGVGDRACALFTREELARLEWLDDVDLLESHSWGSPLNYAIAAPLLQDLRASLQAVATKSQPHMHARLLFGHCETLVPLATLMGLFRPELGPTPDNVQLPNQSVLDAVAPAEEAQRIISEVDSLEDLHTHTKAHTASSLPGGKTPAQEGIDSCVGRHPLDPPAPMPPGWFPMTPFNDTRIFRGGRVGPYGANMAVVLYKSVNPTSATHHSSRFRVRLLYNEQIVALPGCRPVGNPNSDDPAAGLDCDLDSFLEATEAAAGDASTLPNWCDAAPAS